MAGKTKFKVPKGIPLEAIENMNISEIRKLDKDYRRLLKGGKKKNAYITEIQ